MVYVHGEVQGTCYNSGMSNANPKLTGQQQAFVNEYLVDRNASAAARRAGYSEKTANVQGSRLLTNVNVSAAVEKGMKKLQKRTEITAETVIEWLEEQRDKALAADPPQVAAANKAAELIGKHIADMWPTKSESHVKVDHGIDLSNLSQAHLDAIIEATRPAIEGEVIEITDTEFEVEA